MAPSGFFTPPDIFSGSRQSRARISSGGCQSGQGALRLIVSLPVQVKPWRPTEIG